MFQRVLARIGNRPDWVLKGGYCLEARLALRARATIDLDLATATQYEGDGLDLQDDLDEILEADLGDGFTFAVARPRRINVVGERDAWRVAVGASVEGRLFAEIKLDIVTQFDELRGAVDRLAVVYRERDDAQPPVALLDLPKAWDSEYPALLARHELAVGAASVGDALDLVRAIYARALHATR